MTAEAAVYKMNDGIIRAKISARHLNRIAVKNDRIAAVSGIEGAYFFEKNEKSGDGLIKPTADNGYEPISLNITTLSGKNQDLLLEIIDGDPQTVELDGGHDVFAPAADLPEEEAGGGYEAAVVEALKLLILGKNLPKAEPEDAPARDIPNFKTDFLEAFKLPGFTGYKFKVSASFEAAVELRESNFTREGDAALSFSRTNICKNRPVFLYVLRKT
jgi:hypothetical protein